MRAGRQSAHWLVFSCDSNSSLHSPRSRCKSRRCNPCANSQPPTALPHAGPVRYPCRGRQGHVRDPASRPGVRGVSKVLDSYGSLRASQVCNCTLLCACGTECARCVAWHAPRSGTPCALLCAWGGGNKQVEQRQLLTCCWGLSDGAS